MSTIRKTLDSYLRLGEKDNGIVSQLMFFIPFGIWAGIKLLQKTYVFDTLGISFNFLAIRIALLAIIVARELLFGQWDRRAFAGLMLFTGMAIIAYRAGWNHLVDGAVFIFAARNIPFRKLALFFAIEVGALTGIVIICSLAGWLPQRAISTPQTRYSLGFTWVNTAASFCFYATCTWVYLRNDRFTFVEAALALMLAGFIYWQTHSRAAFYASIVLIALSLILPRIGKPLGKRRVFKALCICSVASIAIVVALISFFFDPAVPWMNQLDRMLTGRLTLAHANIVQDGIKLLGQHLSFGSVTKNPTDLVDCLYPKLLIHAGLLFFVASIVLCTLQCKRSVNARCWCMIAIFIAIALHAISEPFAAYLFFNPFLFLLGEFFGNRENGSPEPKSSKPMKKLRHATE